MTYTRTDYIRAWIRSLFGIFVALLIGYVLSSFFLGLIAFAFLFFIPFQRDTFERTFNGSLFGMLMIIILFFAFSFGSSADIGLSLSLGIGLSVLQYLVVGLFSFAIIARAILFGAASVSYFRWAQGTRRMARNVRRSRFPTILNVLIIGLLIALLAVPGISLQPWLWNFSAILFIGIWLISFLGGIFSDVQSRQILGVVMILISFVIFTLGIGSNLVGEAAFGQWWPVVKNFGDNTITPIFSTFANFADSLKEGMRVITCPACVAQEIISGTYGRDSQTGVSGAFGVEFTRISTQPLSIFPYEDYSVRVDLNNKGQVDAKNVELNLVTGQSPTSGIIFGDKISLQELGFVGETKKEFATFPKGQAESIEFETTGGLECPAVNKYGLESKSLPLIVNLEYDYNVHSDLNVEVLREDRWKDRISQGLASTRTPSIMTNSPVKLNLDVGEQPKVEKSKIILSMEVNPESSSTVDTANITKVVLNYPKELEWDHLRSCRGYIPEKSGPSNNYTIVWENSFPATGFVNCHFELPNITIPATTFHFSADSEYRASSSKDLSTQLDWKRGCCSDTVCSGGLECSWKEGDTEMGVCDVAGSGNGGSTNIIFGNEKWCEQRGFATCQPGFGGCTETNQCTQQTREITLSDGSIKQAPNTCREVPGASVDICCFDDPSFDSACAERFNECLKDPASPECVKTI